MTAPSWLAFALAAALACFPVVATADAVAGAPVADDTPVPAPSTPTRTTTADHSKFEQLQGPFRSGPEVTEACLGCHTEAASQVHGSVHWNWRYEHPTTGQTLGKRHALNNLCLGIVGSYERCASCHVGYGWQDEHFDFSAQNKVDCLVCHDRTGTYEKFPTGAGHPAYEDTVFRGRMFEAVDLAQVAQNVGQTSRATCGSCHFHSGGGDAVKHGDLDSSLLAPSRVVDVHMSPEGLDFNCSTCHEFSGHDQAGSRYLVTAVPQHGIAVPGRESDRPACQSCHGDTPHARGIHDKLNQHAELMACQTCHVPEIARGGLATKTLWDWSTAGRRNEAGVPVVERNDEGQIIYDGMKGDFEWRENYPPIYRWFDGTMRYTEVGEPIDPSRPVDINRPEGEPRRNGARSTGARIWPFKVLEGHQPYDEAHQHIVVPRLFGRDETAYWRGYDWNRAIEAGMAEARRVGQTDAEFSGRHGFVETRMYWPVTHMVAPAEMALSCEACHTVGGRLEGLAGVYIPGRDRHPLIEGLGWLAVFFTLLGVLGHGLMRAVMAMHRRRPQPAASAGDET